MTTSHFFLLVFSFASCLIPVLNSREGEEEREGGREGGREGEREGGREGGREEGEREGLGEGSVWVFFGSEGGGREGGLFWEG